MKITISFSEPPSVRCFDEVLLGVTRAWSGVVISHMDGLSMEFEVPDTQRRNRRQDLVARTGREPEADEP